MTFELWVKQFKERNTDLTLFACDIERLKSAFEAGGRAEIKAIKASEKTLRDEFAMNKTKLKPCPFCGSSAKLHTNTSAESIWAYFKIECVKCRAQLMTDLVWRNANSQYLQDVIRAMLKSLVGNWNTRTDAL